VKQEIANRTVSDGMKRILCYAYQRYADYYKIQWKKPKYIAKSREIKIPTKQKIEKLIASAHAPLNLKLQISYEDGLRPIELYTLRPKDIDFEQKKLYPETAKNGRARFLPISDQLKGMLQNYITNHHTQSDEYLFKGNQQQYSQSFRELRNRLAKNLNDPSYKNIKLYDLRHYFGTTMFAELGNLRIVQKLMGHKHITTTEIYEHLVLMETDPKYTTKTTQTTEEDNQAIADGYEYITERNTFKMWRKRKF
jgi:integrase/recombinase XerD